MTLGFGPVGSNLDPLDEPDATPDPQEIAALAPHYPIEQVLALLRQARPQAAPVPPRAGFLDRVAEGLSGIGNPGASGHAGDVFGANVLAGAARTFGGGRLAERDRQLKAQMDAHQQGNQQRAVEAQAQIAGLGKDYESGVATAKATATTTAAARAAKLKADVDAAKDKKAGEDAVTKEARRRFEDERDYGLKVKGENRMAAKDAKEATGKPPTEYQQKAGFFYGRAKEAAANATKDGLERRILNKAWSLQAPPSLQADPDVREYWRSMESFGLALNRLESGASIVPTEFSKVRQIYFATPGDKEVDIERKAKLRETVLDEMYKLQSPATQAAQGGPPSQAAFNPASLWKR